MSALRWVRADNPGPFTLDGTRTYVVGLRKVAVVDPGPDLEDHVRAVFALVRDADEVSLVLTHGHPDHVGGVDRLVALLERTGSRRVDVFGAGHKRAKHPTAVRGIYTDAGSLITIPTPGHTRDHLAFHWPAERALFAGDFMMGKGDTTWVAGYEGCVADYLSSIARVRQIELAVVHPAHGPSVVDPPGALDRYEAHRRTRIAAVRTVLERDPKADLDTLFEGVYGASVPPELEGAARESLGALREYVDTTGADGVSSSA